MSAHEDILNYYSLKWGERYGIAKKDIKNALKLISEISKETDYDEDDILTGFLYLYHEGNPPKQENIFDKFAKYKNSGKLVKFCKY